jgi:pimeloyl-ACP methyl ester carboxylesterase
MLEDLETGVRVTNGLLFGLARRAAGQPDELDRLKVLLNRLITTISAFQIDIPTTIEHFCDDPREDAWGSLVGAVEVLAGNVRRLISVLEEEQGDFLIEEKGTYGELVIGLSRRERFLSEIKAMSYPPSTRDLTRLRDIGKLYQTIIVSLKQNQADLADYLRRTQQAARAQPEDPKIARTDVVILVHGIRDFALWQNSIRATLEKSGFTVEATNYGRLNLLRFLFPMDWFRRYALSAVSKQVKMVYFAHPNKRVSVIAHSFGTYVISCLLRDEFDIRFHRVIFCGSVVPYDFPFENVVSKFQPPILNEVGTEDIWPAMAESLTPSFGSAGTYGFRRAFVRDRWHNGAAHGYFLNPQFAADFWIPFLDSGIAVEGSNPAAEPSNWVKLISTVKLKYVLGALIVVAGVIVAMRLAPILSH